MLTTTDVNTIKDVEVVDGYLDLTYDEHFQSLLNEDTITPEWLLENAIWAQLEEEDEYHFDFFKAYLKLPIDKWKPDDIMYYVIEMPPTIIDIAEQFNWKKRRLLYLKYTEWYQRKKEELDHLESISKFRNTTVKAVGLVSVAALTLIDKLQQKIALVRVEELKTRDIPALVSAAKTLMELSADTEARALAVDKLMQMFAEEMDASLLKEHMYYMQSQQGEVTE